LKEVIKLNYLNQSLVCTADK